VRGGTVPPHFVGWGSVSFTSPRASRKGALAGDERRCYVLRVNDLFQDKAQEWDELPVPAQISAGVGATLLRKLPLRSSMQVMDFGAGTGLICAHVAPNVDKIYAVDISESMLERLAAKPELQGKVEPVCRNILDEPLGQDVDLIMSAMAMHHVEDTDQLFEAFAAHLSSGGLLAVADLDEEDGSFHPPGVEGVFHHGFDRASLQAKLEAHGFDDVEFSTAAEVSRDGKSFPIFLVTATKR